MDNTVFYKNKDMLIICNDMAHDKIIPENSIDLTITSPPYNVGKEYKSYYDKLSDDEYYNNLKIWLTKCYKITKPDGRLCLNIPIDTGLGVQKSIGADITCLAKKIGWQYKTTIIWNEGNISKKNARGSFMTASSPNVITPVELIVVFYKKQWKKINHGTSDITNDEFISWTNGLWTFSGESKKKQNHPAPFPIELPKRCIKLFSYKEDIIFDPFMGSGTTLVSAKLLKRKCVGIEISSEYCNSALMRINNIVG